MADIRSSAWQITDAVRFPQATILREDGKSIEVNKKIQKAADQVMDAGKGKPLRWVALRTSWLADTCRAYSGTQTARAGVSRSSPPKKCDAD